MILLTKNLLFKVLGEYILSSSMIQYLSIYCFFHPQLHIPQLWSWRTKKKDGNEKKNPLHIDLYPVVWCNAQLNLDCSIHLQTQSFNMPNDFFFSVCRRRCSVLISTMVAVYRVCHWLSIMARDKLENWIFKMSISSVPYVLNFFFKLFSWPSNEATLAAKKQSFWHIFIQSNMSCVITMLSSLTATNKQKIDKVFTIKKALVDRRY